MCNTVCNSVTDENHSQCNGVHNNVRNALRTTSRPDQTRPDCFLPHFSCLHWSPVPERHLSDVPTLSTAGTGK